MPKVYSKLCNRCGNLASVLLSSVAVVVVLVLVLLLVLVALVVAAVATVFALGTCLYYWRVLLVQHVLQPSENC